MSDRIIEQARPEQPPQAGTRRNYSRRPMASTNTHNESLLRKVLKNPLTWVAAGTLAGAGLVDQVQPGAAGPVGTVVNEVGDFAAKSAIGGIELVMKATGNSKDKVEAKELFKVDEISTQDITVLKGVVIESEPRISNLGHIGSQEVSSIPWENIVDINGQEWDGNSPGFTISNAEIAYGEDPDVTALDDGSGRWIVVDFRIKDLLGNFSRKHGFISISNQTSQYVNGAGGYVKVDNQPNGGFTVNVQGEPLPPAEIGRVTVIPSNTQ